MDAILKKIYTVFLKSLYEHLFCSLLEEFKQFINKFDLKSHSLKGPRRVPT